MVGKLIQLPFFWILLAYLGWYYPPCLVALIFTIKTKRIKYYCFVGFISGFIFNSPQQTTWFTAARDIDLKISNWNVDSYKNCYGDAHYQKRKILYTIKKCDMNNIASMVTTKGYFKKIRQRKIPNAFDYKKFLINQGYYGYYQVLKITKEKNAKILLVSQFKNKFKNYLKNQLPNSYGLSYALLLGDKKHLDKNISNTFKKLGLSHLLAISGMHIGLIALIVFSLLKSTQLNWKLNYTITITILFAFTYLCNSPPSAIRATLFFSLIAMFKIIERKTNIWNLLLASAFIQILYNPKEIFQLSFQLSYLAFATIILLLPILKHKPKFIQGIIISTTISISTFIIVVFTFSYFSILTPLHNLWAIPLIFTYLLTSILSVTRLPYLDYASEMTYALLNKTLYYCEKLPNGIWVSKNDSILIGIVFLMILMVWFFKKKHLWFIVTFSILAFSTYKIMWPKSEFEIHFLDVGQGSATLILTPSKALWIDLGSTKHDGVILQKYLYELGYPYSDAIISHGDKDHWAAITNLNIKNLFINIHDSEKSSKQWMNVKNKFKLNTLEFGRKIMIANSELTLRVLHPNHKNHGDKNDNSLVIWVSYQSYNFLITGDISRSVEKRIIHQIPKGIKWDLVTSPHHGSKTSNSKVFYEYLKPKRVLISAGKNNRYGHPSPSTLKNLNTLNIPYWETGNCGSLIYRMRNTMEVSTCMP